MKKIRIGIVDDNSKLINSLKDNLSLFEDVEVIWQANDGEEAAKCVKEQDADVVFMDIEMPGIDGIQGTSLIRSFNQEIKIIILTVFDDSDKIFESILAGASGYLLKDSPPLKMHEAIIEALEGGAPMSPLIAGKALKLISDQGKPNKSSKATTNQYDLSIREMEILKFITEGLTYNDISEKIFISPKTVRNHIQNIYKKLQVNSKAEAINLSYKQQWFR